MPLTSPFTKTDRSGASSAWIRPASSETVHGRRASSGFSTRESLGSEFSVAKGGGLFTPEDKVLAVLVVFVPATLLGSRLGWPRWVVFFLSVAAVVPLAGFIGAATEALADRIGARTGGLLNATFGNAPDLLIGIFGVQRGLIPLVKATLIGALISNSALIMGACYIVAGLRYGRPRFRRAEAGHHSVLMMLTLAAALFPTAGALVLCGGDTCREG